MESVMTQKGNVLSAFSVEHAARVTGISKARLTRWDRLGFFSPEHLDDNDRGNPFARVYSFSDLVGLRTLAILIDKYRISLKELQATYPELAKRVQRPWSETALSVLNGKVIYDLDGSPRDRHGQLAGNHIELPTVASEMAKKAEELRNRRKDLLGSTERHRHVAHNAEVLAGTRIPVKAILGFIDAGYADEAILEEYPSLSPLDIKFVRTTNRAAA